MGKDSGGGGSQTTTATTSYAPWISQMQQALAGIGLGQNMSQLNPTGYSVAGQTTDELAGQDFLRDMFAQFGPGNGNLASFQSMMPTWGGAGARAQATDATAANVSGSDILGGMSPFIQGVIDPAMQNLERQRREQSANIAARNASAASYGGSREAIEQGQLDRSTGETTANMVAQLMSQGYDQAQALALANAQMEQQANLQNATNATNVSLQNAGNELQRQYYGLQGAQMYGNMLDSDYQRQLGLIGALLGSGQTQRGIAQQAIDAPYTALQRIAGLIPGVYNSTQVTQQPNGSQGPSTGQSLLGTALTIGGMGTGGGGTVLGGLLGGLFGGGSKNQFPIAPGAGGGLY